MPLTMSVVCGRCAPCNGRLEYTVRLPEAALAPVEAVLSVELPLLPHAATPNVNAGSRTPAAVARFKRKMIPPR
jgi:hypothetical protein